MSTQHLLFQVDPETKTISAPDSLKFGRPAKPEHDVIFLFLQRATKAELLAGLIRGEMGFCEEDSRVYFKDRNSDTVYFAQMVAE
ncbi:MAG: hypothetical protein ABIW76_24590 [Fibrobacteria bacterium]